LSNSPSIDIILPPKERFTAKNAGAISGVVSDLVTASANPGCFRIVGSKIEAPLNNLKFMGLTARGRWFRGNNIGCAADYLAQIKQTSAPDLIEVHSRAPIATYIKKHRPDLNVSLYLHNDPRDMRGARSPAERTALLHEMAGIICVSDYIRRCFLDGLSVDAKMAAKVNVARNGAQRWLTEKPKKSPIILIAGRMVPEKGILECAHALANILPRYPEWKLVIAGAKRFESAQMGDYEKQIAAAVESLGGQVQMTGFIAIEDVRKWQAKAAIAACPSVWNDPMPKAVLESLAAGCALLTTRRGGIPEAAEGRAHIVDTPDVQSFTAAFETLLGNAEYRHKLQDVAWQDFPFTATAMADAADALRAEYINASRKPASYLQTPD
jgi:glycosyltransferase involved in cell wall biosynthesis